MHDDFVPRLEAQLFSVLRGDDDSATLSEFRLDLTLASQKMDLAQSVHGDGSPTRR